VDQQSDPYADEGDMLREQLTDSADRPTLEDDLRQLMGDGRALLEAELAWQKARASFAGKQAGGIALLGLLALALVFFALMALVFGSVLALAPLLTAWGAMAAVTGGLLLAAALAGLMAALRTRRMVRLIADKQAEP
jgi:hypothetical protein